MKAPPNNQSVTLGGADLDLTLDALDMAIELLETVWSKDPDNTRQDVREIKANIARMWELAERLVVHAPEHPMAFCVPPAHQAEMGATGAGRSNGARRGARERPVPPGNGAGIIDAGTLKPLTRFGDWPFPPVTILTLLLKRSRGASRGEESR